MSQEREPGVDHAARPARVSAVFGVAEFRALWGAEAVSVLGDQFARVAFSVLVFERTDSAALSAMVYALTFLPALLGGALLGWVADRYPRRRVMIVSDLGRMLLALPMVWPGLPLPVLCALIIATVLLGSPHTAAQGALLPEVLRGDLLERGYAVRQITGQTAQVAGFATGGAVLVVLAPHATLAINAATFGISALVVRLGVRRRPSPAGTGSDAGTPRSWTGDIAEGARTVFGDPQLRTLALIVWLAGCFIAPEGLAVSYAAELGAGPLAVGLLMAAIPAGSVVGALVFTRWVPRRVRERATLPLAIAAGPPLGVSALVPSVGVAIVLWSVTGACVAAALVQAQASFVRRAPVTARGRATGLAAAGLIGAQGLALLAGGLVAQRWSSAAGVAAVGTAAVLLLVGLLATAPARELSRGSP
ncbi:MFS transporter [Pseudonocardia sp. KRD291]|uniref:MFS transporter n=1 Tax=Pseudonocardia sp. KRD291 TaxID=2792007 RepID=UPI001C4A5261|nr:MFS transporter [Pseudonocardia sp. KRD291]MBW0104050.1 MFS transporter [Pseudonocardia sp. KRD291]